jgi:hypothetical protein
LKTLEIYLTLCIKHYLCIFKLYARIFILSRFFLTIIVSGGYITVTNKDSIKSSLSINNHSHLPKLEEIYESKRLKLQKASSEKGKEESKSAKYEKFKTHSRSSSSEITSVQGSDINTNAYSIESRVNAKNPYSVAASKHSVTMFGYSELHPNWGPAKFQPSQSKILKSQALLESKTEASEGANPYLHAPSEANMTQVEEVGV